jgi:hypothetical protein
MGQKTPLAAEVLGISESHAHYLIWSKKIRPPQRDSSGDFLWSASDIAAAREALKVDRRRKTPSVAEGAHAG